MEPFRRWWAGVRGRVRRGRRDDARPADGSPSRDYPREREDARVAGMSEDDRAWEAASRQRDRDRRAPDQTQ